MVLHGEDLVVSNDAKREGEIYQNTSSGVGCGFVGRQLYFVAVVECARWNGRYIDRRVCSVRWCTDLLCAAMLCTSALRGLSHFRKYVFGPY